MLISLGVGKCCKEYDCPEDSNANASFSKFRKKQQGSEEKKTKTQAFTFERQTFICFEKVTFRVSKGYAVAQGANLRMREG